MEYCISTDKEKLDVAKIHSYLSKESYWGRDRSMEEVIATIENSLCFGLYSESDEQLGFARIVTDGVIFAYLMDFVIFGANQGKGLGKKLILGVLDHNTIKKVKTIALKTKDAHGFYEQFGFERVGNSALWMSIDKVILL